MKLSTSRRTSTLLLPALLTAGAAQAADTVSKVVTLPVSSGVHVVRIYFSSHVNDRWSCLQANGYVEANDASTRWTLKDWIASSCWPQPH